MSGETICDLGDLYDLGDLGELCHLCPHPPAKPRMTSTSHPEHAQNWMPPTVPPCPDSDHYNSRDTTRSTQHHADNLLL